MVIFLNKQFVNAEDANIHVSDLGFLRGYGIFEFARSYAGQIFRLEDHLDRFFKSAKILDLSIPYNQQTLTQLCYELLEQCNIDNGGIKLILSGGRSISQFSIEENPSFVMMAQPVTTPASPLKVATAIYERHMPSCKTLNYLVSMYERQQIRVQGFDEPLFLNRDRNVLEGAKENVFAFKGETLITPKDGILPGVTRKVVMEMYPTEERALSYDELMECDEVFFTSTVREIAPISQIDDKNYAVKKSLALQQLYENETNASGRLRQQDIFFSCNR